MRCVGRMFASFDSSYKVYGLLCNAPIMAYNIHLGNRTQLSKWIGSNALTASGSCQTCGPFVLAHNVFYRK